MKMFVMAKYRTRIARTQNIFVRKCTWPSGRVTAGRRSVSGFRAYRRLFFFSSRGIGLLPGVPWEDDLAASAGAAAVLLAAPVGSAAAQLARPRDHLCPPRGASARGAS